MQFTLDGKRYDLRLKNRYLPKSLRNINALDLVILLANTSSKEYKLSILREYDKGVTL